MSFFGAHIIPPPTSTGKEKSKNRRRSSSIKHALGSFLGSGNSKNQILSGSNAASSQKQARQAAAGRRSSAPAISAMPAGFSPMMAFGTPYSMMYNSPDYIAPHELSMTSGADTDDDDNNNPQGNNSLFNFREDDDVDDLDFEDDSRSFRVRRLYSDSHYDNDDGDDEREVTSLHTQDDNEGDPLRRKTTLMSNSVSVAGSHYSSVSYDLKKSARKVILDYLGERGFLKPKKTSSKNGLSFHLATSADTVFLQTVSANDDEYLNHLNRLAEQGDGTAEERQQLEPSEPSGTELPIRGTETNSSISTTSNRQFENINSSTNDSTDLSFEEEHGIGDSSATLGDSERVPYNVAVIMSLKTPMELSAIKAELSAKVRVYWARGLPPERMTHEEYYNIGQLKWDFNPENFNLYVGISATENELVVKEQKDPTKVNKTRLFKACEDEERIQYLPKNKGKELFLKSLTELPKIDNEYCVPGYYVFILPVVFANNVPESIYVPCAVVEYEFRCGVKIIESTASTLNGDGPRFQSSGSVLSASSNSGLLSDLNDDSAPSTAVSDSNSTSHLKIGGSKLLRKMKSHLHMNGSSVSKEDLKPLLHTSIRIPIVRTPPLRSVSTADKPIYINRVWTDALSYEISFAQKYVPLGTDVPLKIKLIPLTKNLSIKRVRVSVVEKITYVSKNLEFEFDQIDQLSNDPYSPYYPELMARRKRERTLPLLEIRTRDRGGRAIREDIVENCKSENLLSYFSVKDEETKNDVDMIEPLTISTHVTFPKYKVMDRKTSRNIPPYGIDEFTQVSTSDAMTGSRRGSTASGVLDFFAGRKSRKNSIASNGRSQYKPETKIRTNSNVNILKRSKHNEPKRGLYASSVNFSHIHVKHKLELMLRISKPDATDPNKQRHFEVLIDTPVNIVSELCTYDNLELPTYAMATMSETRVRSSTTFEEPLPTFEQAISVPNSPKLSPMGSPQIQASYDVDDLSIQQLMLSRATTQNADDVSTQTGASSSAQYSNLDEMMNSPAPTQGIVFRDSFANTSEIQSDSAAQERDSESEGEEEIPLYGEPPTYEEITPLM